MTENEQKEVQQGQCYNCPYYLNYTNFCSYYNIVLNDNGVEPTCNNPELKQKDNG